MTNFTNTDRSIVDRTIALLRIRADGQTDNRALARCLWLILSLAVVGAGMYIYLAFAYTGPPSKYQAFADIVAIVGTTFVLWYGIGSLVGPTLRIERWLDERYPDHAVDGVDYSLVRDVFMSGLLVVYYGLYGIATWFFVSIAGLTLSLLEGLDASGAPLTETTIAELTVVNTVAVLLITAAVCAWGLIKTADYLIGDDVAVFSGPETNGFNRFTHLSGGDADGA